MNNALHNIVEILKKNPAKASDPAFIRMMERESMKGFDGSYRALTVPMAKLTREIATLMDPARVETGRLSIEFPRPIKVICFLASLRLAPGAVGVLPTTEDLLVSIDADTEQTITAGSSNNTAAIGGSSNKFVTLDFMLSDSSRVVGWKVKSPRPDIGFQVRWRNFVSPGPAPFAATDVRIAVLADYLDED